MKDYVYYICFGSNLLEERFHLYITGGENKELNIKQVGCKDKTLPIKTIQYQIPHPVYFAKSSSKWQGKGVAFLDTTIKGHSYGRGYLITKEQYLEVSKQEGAWYDSEFYLGEIEGYPLYTITSHAKYNQNNPSDEYLDVIYKGIKQTYKDLKDKEIEEYLKRSIL